MRGIFVDSDSLSTSCEGSYASQDIQLNLKILNSSTLTNTSAAYSCGLIAKCYFNDTYGIFNADTGTKVPIDEGGISIDSDRTYKFLNQSDTIDGKKPVDY